MTVAPRAAVDRRTAAAEEWLGVLRGAGAVVDNMLTAHGGRPFTGARRVLVAMGNSYRGALGASPARTADIAGG